MPKVNQPPPEEEIVVHRAKVKHNLSRDRMALKIGDFIGKDDGALDSEAYQWLTRCSRTEVLPGFELPSETDPPDIIWQKFEAYLEMDDDILEEWKRLVNAANAPTGSRKFVPPENLTEAEKKDSPKSESSGEPVLATG